MRFGLACVTMVLGCSQPRSSGTVTVIKSGGPPGETPVTAAAPPPHQLNDVQLDCRSKWIGDIGESNAMWGRGCASNTMPLAMQTFDLGSFDGFLEAEDQVHLITMLCLCAAGPCPPDLKAKLDRQLAQLADDPEKTERDHVAVITNQAIRSSSCLDTAVTVHLYKKGYTCGYLDGSVSPTLRHEMESAFRQVATPVENAESLAHACWVNWASSRSPS